jgi:hypothetical protein
MIDYLMLATHHLLSKAVVVAVTLIVSRRILSIVFFTDLPGY